MTAILLDVGNTAITYGIAKGGRIITFGSCRYNDIPKIIKKCTQSGSKNHYRLVFMSVVPKISSFIKKSTRQRGISILEAGKNLPLRIAHKYLNYKRLGIDRAVNIYGALRLYKTPFVIVDFGTAITFDYVSTKGVFEGGLIIPGPELSFQALLQRAALIPKNLKLPSKASSFLGRTTYDCLSSGILEGYGAMTDGLISRLKKHYGKKLKVIATGGFLKHLKPYTASLGVCDPKHSIKSLLLLYKDSQRTGLV